MINSDKTENIIKDAKILTDYYRSATDSYRNLVTKRKNITDGLGQILRKQKAVLDKKSTDKQASELEKIASDLTQIEKHLENVVQDYPKKEHNAERTAKALALFNKKYLKATVNKKLPKSELAALLDTIKEHDKTFIEFQKESDEIKKLELLISIAKDAKGSTNVKPQEDDINKKILDKVITATKNMQKSMVKAENDYSEIKRLEKGMESALNEKAATICIKNLANWETNSAWKTMKDDLLTLTTLVKQFQKGGLEFDNDNNVIDPEEMRWTLLVGQVDYGFWLWFIWIVSKSKF